MAISVFLALARRLHFRPRAVGRLKMAQELAKLLGILLYRYGLRHVGDRQLAGVKT